MEKYALCAECEWHGLRTDLVCTDNAPLDEQCPECGSFDTEWTDCPPPVDTGDELHQVLADAINKTNSVGQ